MPLTVEENPALDTYQRHKTKPTAIVVMLMAAAVLGPLTYAGVSLMGAWEEWIALQSHYGQENAYVTGHFEWQENGDLEVSFAEPLMYPGYQLRRVYVNTQAWRDTTDGQTQDKVWGRPTVLYDGELMDRGATSTWTIPAASLNPATKQNPVIVYEMMQPGDDRVRAIRLVVGGTNRP